MAEAATSSSMPETHGADSGLILDGWELRPNGTAMLSIDGRRFTLKAPSFGELRTISEAIEAAGDSVTLAAHEADARKTELREARERGEFEPAQAALEDKKLGRQFNAHVEEQWWEALCLVFDLLGSAQLPARDELPAWVPASAADQVAVLISHWKSGPKVRGGR